MDTSRFIEKITRNSFINELDTQEIALEREQAPYCSIFSVLQAASVSETMPDLQNKWLWQAAVYVPDRSFLKYKLLQLKETQNSPVSKAPEVLAETVVELTETQNNLVSETVEPEPLSVEPVLSARDIFEEINSYEEISLKTASKKELIEKFLEIESPKIKKPEAIKENISVSQPEESKEFVSETLASLYEKQGNYKKALKIYEELCLKFPEKSDTFAIRIENLKKLIIT